MKRLLKTKHIALAILILTSFFLIGSVFRYIHLQNIQYQKLSEETNIRQQTESREEESLTEIVTPEMKEQKQEVEREYRDDTLMIF